MEGNDSNKRRDVIFQILRVVKFYVNCIGCKWPVTMTIAVYSLASTP